MNEDPYKVLRLKPDASQEDVHRAAKRLTRMLHLDLNPDSKSAEEKFKEVSAAHDLLGDPKKRACFDRSEIDAPGAERPQPRYYRVFAEAARPDPYASDAGFADFAGTDELLASLFGHRRGVRMGGDLHARLALDFLEFVNGTTKRLQLPDGSTVDVAVPPDDRDGQVLHLRGKGHPGIGSGLNGDLLVELEVCEHHRFTRRGGDIRFDLPASLLEAALGSRWRHRHRWARSWSPCPRVRTPAPPYAGGAFCGRTSAATMRTQRCGWSCLIVPMQNRRHALNAGWLARRITRVPDGGVDAGDQRGVAACARGPSVAPDMGDGRLGSVPAAGQRAPLLEDRPGTRLPDPGPTRHSGRQ